MAFGGETAESYYDEGLTASMRGDLNRAVKCFEKSLELDNGFLAAEHQLGRCFLRMGYKDDALRILHGVVSKRPAQMAPRLDLGYAFLEREEHAKAEKVFNDVLNADNANARAHMGLAHVRFREADWSGAVGHAEEALAHGGSHFAAHFVLGRAAKLAGSETISKSSLQKAEELIEKSVEVKPTHPEGYYLRGEVAYVKEEYRKAIEHYKEAEEHAEPDTYYAAYGEHFTLWDILAKQGLCRHHLGESHEAKALGERIAQGNPEHKLGQWLSSLEAG